MKFRDLREDRPLSLADAAEFLSKITGEKPHISTLWRRCQTDRKGFVSDCEEQDGAARVGKLNRE